MRYWLAKSEPEAYSIADLARDKEGVWDGVRNYQVRNLMRDEMRAGDKVIFYHSNAGKETGAVGIMVVAGAAVADELQFMPASTYYDPSARRDAPRWLALPVRYQETFQRPVRLPTMRADRRLKGMRMLARGNRLSITPVTKEEFDRIVTLGRSEGEVG
jgi:predicted RNA-binding protein with PUA-like domain